MSPLTVRDLMTADPITIAADAPLMTGEKLLRHHNVSGLPVVDTTGTLVGVLSRTDVLSARWEHGLGFSWPGLRVRYLMTSPGITARPETTLQHAATLMARHGVRRLIVVDGPAARPIGILSSTDLDRGVAAMEADEPAAGGHFTTNQHFIRGN